MDSFPSPWGEKVAGSGVKGSRRCGEGCPKCWPLGDRRTSLANSKLYRGTCSMMQPTHRGSPPFPQAGDAPGSHREMVARGVIPGRHL